MSDAMHEYLAEFYGTAGAAAPSQEDQEKVAQVELFAKLASDQGINLDELTGDQVQYLWDQTFSAEKTAEGHGHCHKDKKAEAEYAEKRAAAEKLAEADFLGRVMAHAYVQELNKIGEAKEAGKLQEMGGKLERYGELMSGSKARDLKAKAEQAVAGAKRTHSSPDMGGAPSKANAKWKEIANKRSGESTDEAKKVFKTRAITGAAVGGTAAAGTAAALAAKKKKKEASAFEEKAAEVACIMAAEAGLDLDEVSEKMAGVLAIGLEDSEKVAAAADFETAVQTRALEMLEAVGYPVTWNY